MNPWAIQNSYELWRLITPLFLTNGFTQYIYNSFFLMIFGFIFTATKMPFHKMLAFYLLCGFGGYLFSCTCDTDGYLEVGC
jgi:membrane associated rhomboid family serine protease